MVNYQLTYPKFNGNNHFAGTKGDWDFRISHQVKTLMELIFNPCGEFRWSPEAPVSQIHSPHFHDGLPGIFSDLLRSVQMLKREREREREREVRKVTGSYSTYSSPVKLQPGFISLRWKTCLWAELQPLVPEFAVEDLPLGKRIWWWIILQ